MKSRCMNCMRKLENDTGACPHCGFDPGQYKPPEQTLPPGATLYNGKYIIGRVLGRGGFGVTYVALDTTLELRVAIKECLPRNCAWRNDSGASVQWGLSVPEQEAMLESFVKEARKMAKIDQIPGVVRVREYFYDNETAYIVMDYVEGETLAQYLRRNGSLSAGACFRLLAPAMDSLAEAHKRGLIHRDISPNNIMIERDGKRVWILDLGAAKDMGSRLSAPNVSAGTQIVGTPGYTPLEQYSPDGKIGAWTDVHAMSATFFYSMTGQKPPSSTTRALEASMPEVLYSVSGLVGEALRKGLALRPEERYQSMSELRNALKTAIEETARMRKNAETQTEVLVQENPPETLEPVAELSQPETPEPVAEPLQPETPKAITETPPRKKGMLAPILFLCVALALGVLGIMLTRNKSVTPENETEVSTGIIASGGCGENVSWTLDENGLMTVSGTGNMWDYYNSFDSDYEDYKNIISSVNILSGITNIGRAAFENCSQLSSVRIPDSVETINGLAFSHCTALTNINIPDGVNLIGWNAFDNCSNLSSITIPNGVSKISGNTFLKCSNLTNVIIPDSVTIIEEYAFYACTSLENIKIPDSVRVIGDMAFRDCTNLKSVSIGSNTAFTKDYPSSNTFGSDTIVTRREASSNTAEDALSNGDEPEKTWALSQKEPEELWGITP